MNKKMRVIAIVAGSMLLLTVAILIIIERDMVRKTRNFLFYLDEKYYGSGAFIEAAPEEITALIEQEESFAVYIHRPFCSASYEFNRILTQFANEQKLSFYKLSFEDMQKTELGDVIEYYPSFAIYKEGELIDFLEADSDEDLNRYKDKDAFKDWFGSYIQLQGTEE